MKHAGALENGAKNRPSSPAHIPSPPRFWCYDGAMNTKTQRSIRLPLIAGLAMALGIVALLAFRGWMENGAEMFLALAQSGLAWCL